VDLLPTAERVFVLNPAQANPALDAPEIVPGKAAEEGRIARSGGFGSPGEAARLERDARGRVQAVWLGGTRLQSEARTSAELRRRYGQGTAGG
jgi:D-alanyl-D-alanine carboxypeptidase